MKSTTVQQQKDRVRETTVTTWRTYTKI